MSNSNKNSVLWTEKYRPKTLDELVIDESVRNRIAKIIEEKTMPNIIIAGESGTGKTTTIQCIANALLGKYIDEGVLEKDASDYRGIRSVQDSIINFCKKKFDIYEPEPQDNNSANPNTKNKTKYTKKYSDHKIILLDEADNMTKKVQQSINTLMEDYNKATRFAFTCNDSSKIIEAIQSRCIILRYTRLTPEQIKERLVHICILENAKVDDGGLDKIIGLSSGDMRMAINILKEVLDSYDEVNENNLCEIFNIPKSIIIEDIFANCVKKDFENSIRSLYKLIDIGCLESDILLNMFETLKLCNIDGMDESTKIRFLEIIGKTFMNVSKGMSSKLQLTGCISRMIYIKE